MKKLFLTLLIATIFLPLGSFANQETNLSISPIIVEKKIDPGKSAQEVLTVLNKSSKPMAVKVYAENFSAADEFGGMVFDTEDNGEYTLKSWVKFDKSNLIINPKSSEKVTITVDIPTNAEPGGHYGVVFFEPVIPKDSPDKSSLGISSRIGALFFVTASGEILEKGRVLGATSADKCSGVQCSFKTARFREWGPVPFQFKFENTGNVHVKVKGKIEIYNLFGMKVGDVAVDEKTVLPKSTRYFDVKWLREPLLGYYKAKLILNYGSLNVTDRAQVGFWAFPWKIALIVLAFAVTIYFFWTRRRKKRARLNKNGLQREKMS